MDEPGQWASIDPASEDILFREDPLSRTKIEALKPFRPELSNASQPIRVVATREVKKVIMQGNHRVMAALEQGLRSVPALVYNEEQWEILTEMAFVARGTNNPRIVP